MGDGFLWWAPYGRCYGVLDWTERPTAEQLADCALCPVVQLCRELVDQIERDTPDSYVMHHAVYAGMTGRRRVQLRLGQR